MIKKTSNYYVHVYIFVCNNKWSDSGVFIQTNKMLTLITLQGIYVHIYISTSIYTYVHLTILFLKLEVQIKVTDKGESDFSLTL